MISRFYYTLDELTGNNYDSFVLSSDVGFYEICSYLLSKSPAIAQDDAYTKKLMYHIWLNLSQKYLLYLDVEHPRWEHVERKSYDGFGPEEMYEVHSLGQNMLSIFEDSKDRYLTLIKLYEDELDNLMAPITTTVANNSTTTASGTNETRFNDTPQNTLANGEYADDNFTTNITSAESGSTVGVVGRSTTENDGMSKMSRINEVQKMLENLYADWAFEFNKLIVGE